MTDLDHKIGILGTGQMGIGIAQVAVQAGFFVFLADQNKPLAEEGKEKLAAIFKKLVEKGKIQAPLRAQYLNAVCPVSNLQEFHQATIVIEAISEKPSLKFDIFKQLDSVCPPHTIFASNTSSISITTLAAQTNRPALVGGMHFMNPVPLMKLVEGVRGLQTSNETFHTIRWVAEKMGKTFVEVKDFPGFAVNRILMPMINEAITAVHEGVASIQDIDTAMMLGTNQPMGPLALADFIGLDTCLAIMQVLHDGLGDSKYRPCPLLKQYVSAGWLGKKAGRGFYHYDI